MPFTGASDPKLPDRVKKLSAKRRRQFVSIFNSVFSSTGDEGRAFAAANSAIKELEMSEPSEDQDEKHYGEEHDMTQPSSFHSFGGALTFDDVDSYREGLELDQNVQDQKRTFDGIFDNIWAHPELTSTQKEQSVVAAASELSRRISNPPEKSVFEKAKEFFFGERSEEGVHFRVANGGEFAVTKDDDGGWRWLVVHSNKYVDRDQEIFSSKSHREFEEWVDRNKEYPELRLWHVPGTRIGVADFIAFDEDSGFMLGSGVFDKGMEHIAESLAEDPHLAVSQGYRYKDEDLSEEGVYEKYWTYEISVLPSDNTANPFTSFTSSRFMEEVGIPMKKEKREFLEQHLGKERTDRVVLQLETLGKELSDAGVRFKDAIEDDPEPDTSSKETATAVAEPEAPVATVTPEAPVAVATVEDPKETVPDGNQELITAVGAVVQAAVKPLQEELSSLQQKVKELGKSDDEKVAELVTPRTNAAAAGEMTRPTADGSNLMDPKDGAASTKDEDDDSDKPGSYRAASPYVQQMLNGAKLGSP